jgi:hypothetical protein
MITLFYGEAKRSGLRTGQDDLPTRNGMTKGAIPAHGGASPSGKAAAFDAAIRRFESCRPSQVLQLRLIDFAGWCRCLIARRFVKLQLSRRSAIVAPQHRKGRFANRDCR